jgi:type I restriction enzyme S subunit
MNIVGPPLGKVSVVPDTYPAWNMNQAIVLFRASGVVLSRYLAICLMSDEVLRWITRTAKATAGQFNISVGNSRLLPIPLPPLAEQEQIVALVEERLSQIDSAEKTIDAELIRSKRLRQSILKRAFEGKLVPQDPKDEPANVLLERIKASRDADQPKKKSKKATKVKAK